MPANQAERPPRLQCSSDRCNLTFVDLLALSEHLDESGAHNWCYLCRRDFITPTALKSHKSQKHGYCASCKTNTGGLEQLKRHNVRAHGYCSQCDSFLGSLMGLILHCASYGLHLHFPCPKPGCTERFASPANLHAHLNSSNHVEARIKCPFCDDDNSGTPQRFISYSAVASHIDANGCILKRRKFNELAYECDTKRTVIDKKVHPQNSIPLPIVLLKLELARFMGYDCLWGGCSKTFQDLAGLQSHLQSPAHEADMYRCPGCEERFKGMSGVYQHVGSLVSCNLDHVELERKMKGIMDRVKLRFEAEK